MRQRCSPSMQVVLPGSLLFRTMISAGKESARVYRTWWTPSPPKWIQETLKHQATEERWPVAEPPHPPPQPPLPPPPSPPWQLGISLQFLGNRQFRVKRNRGSCGHGDNSKHGANVQDAGLRAALGHCSHHTFISLLCSDGLLTEPRRCSCVAAHLRIYPSTNPILMYPSVLEGGQKK